MAERRVRVPARSASYGRAKPLARPVARRGPRLPSRVGGLGTLPRRALVLAAALVLLGFGLKQLFAITSVTVDASQQGSQLQAAAQRLIAAHWSQQTTLTIDTGQLESQLLVANPGVKTLQIQRQWPHGLKLTATLKQPSLGWATGNQTYLLDRDGTAIGPFAAGLPMPVVYDGSNLPVDLGHQVASARFVGFALEVAHLLPNAGLSATRYEVKDTTLDLYVTTNKGYQLILDTSRPAADEISDLKTLLGFMAKQGKTPTQYINLQVPGKAYYK